MRNLSIFVLSNVFFFFQLLIRFCLNHWFWEIWYDVTRCNFFIPFVLGFYCFLDLWVDNLYQIQRNYFYRFFPAHPICPSFSGAPTMCVYLTLEVIPQLADALFIYFHLFPLCFILDSFYCCVFKFMNFFLFNIS